MGMSHSNDDDDDDDDNGDTTTTAAASDEGRMVDVLVISSPVMLFGMQSSIEE